MIKMTTIERIIKNEVKDLKEYGMDYSLETIGNKLLEKGFTLEEITKAYKKIVKQEMIKMEIKYTNVNWEYKITNGKWRNKKHFDLKCTCFEVEGEEIEIIRIFKKDKKIEMYIRKNVKFILDERFKYKTIKEAKYEAEKYLINMYGEEI